MSPNECFFWVFLSLNECLFVYIYFSPNSRLLLSFTILLYACASFLYRNFSTKSTNNLFISYFCGSIAVVDTTVDFLLHFC